MKLVGFACIVLAFACTSEPTQIKLTGASPTGGDPHAVVWLWGYDTGLADAGASLIASYHQPFTTTLELDIPADPHELIDQGNGPVPAHDARFYFSVYVDLDNDAQLCPGDLRQDYDALAWASFDAPPRSLTVPLVPIDDGNECRSIVP